MSDSENSNNNSSNSLLRSVSTPVPNSRGGKGFVRPNCSTTFWLQCPVCCKRYFKYDSHIECFGRWCEICQDVLPTLEAMRQHGLTYHRKNFCTDCCHVYENIRGHRTYEHATNESKPKRVTRLSRAQTITPTTL